ncbi:hypothetical protein [Actinokineospora sp. UTMC 2448]|uniref:hypothetical protein n=1 Tax=Actinokineospora sp. UTMC 2448 TaxID=2268449 RepID=UPI002164ACA0|nr:hypothetical protein [Actinokineospora sp. UTMC 2448]
MRLDRRRHPADIDAAIARHKADHQAARPRTIRCSLRGCDWTTRGDQAWARAAGNRHRAEHAADADAREARRATRYRWRDTPSPTQLRLLRAVAAGDVQASACRGEHHVRWYPIGPPRERPCDGPPLSTASWSAHAPPSAAATPSKGVWRLTDAGRDVLTGAT